MLAVRAALSSVAKDALGASSQHQTDWFTIAQDRLLSLLDQLTHIYNQTRFYFFHGLVSQLRVPLLRVKAYSNIATHKVGSNENISPSNKIICI